MRRPLRIVIACVAIAFALVSCDSGDDDSTASTTGSAESVTEQPTDDGARTRLTIGGMTVETTSTRAGLVSGGDVLVTVTGADADLTVTLGGDDISSAFTATGSGTV